MTKILYAGCFGQSPAVSTQFAVEMCVAAQNRKKITKTYFGGSRSFKVIDVNTTKKSVASACYDKQHVCTICNHFDAKQENSGKITSF